MSAEIEHLFAPTEISDQSQVAWVTLGNITYIDGSLRDVWADWLAVLDALVGRPWAQNLINLRRSDHARISPVDARLIRAYQRELSQLPAGRSHLAGELSDGLEFPQTTIEFRDVEPSQWGAFRRASYVRVRLPLDTDPEELVWISRLFTYSLPINQGVAGYLCHIDGRCRGLSSDQAWAWARRYYGLHIVEPVAVSWDAPRGICASNWITLLGERWLQDDAALGPHALEKLPSDIAVEALTHGRLIQACARPLLGDQNRGEDLSRYSEVATALDRGFVDSPTEYLGMFSDLECTQAWMRRLVEPIGWRDSSQ